MADTTLRSQEPDRHLTAEEERADHTFEAIAPEGDINCVPTDEDRRDRVKPQRIQLLPRGTTAMPLAPEDRIPIEPSRPLLSACTPRFCLPDHHLILSSPGALAGVPGGHRPDAHDRRHQQPGRSNQGPRQKDQIMHQIHGSWLRGVGKDKPERIRPVEPVRSSQAPGSSPIAKDSELDLASKNVSKIAYVIMSTS